jgi:predicted LPLAT superfamily acyltransferase
MHWARVGEAGFSGGMRFLYWIYRHGGAGAFRILLLLVMPWFFLSHGIARRASLEYLTRLHATSGGKTPAPTWRNSFRHFMNFGETILDKFVAANVREDIRKPYQVNDTDYLNHLFDTGQGAIIMTAHLGNLELCRRLVKLVHTGMKLTVLVHTRHARRFNRMLKSLNPEQEIDLIQVDSVNIATAMLLSERISAGGFVVIAGDRVPVTSINATQPHLFLGQEALFPLGPYILAATLACPVLVMFGARDGEGFAVTSHLLAERIVLPRRARTEAVRPYLDAYVAALTEACLKHPLQWFNFFPFWQLPAVANLSLSNDEKPTKPLA